MCGIAGYVSSHEKPDLARVRSMCDQIRHRGPDDEGFHVDRFAALGMRRLSIIDLATGHQPIANEDGTIWVVFNGEIYNYRQLRETLQRQGHRFATQSDTEVLVHLYEQEGIEGISHLRGMFAFALWDSRARRLLLARDRFGKKPLYYASVPGGFYFASELKSLRAAGVPLEMDRQALRLYLQFGYIPDPWSPFQGIKKTPAGSWLVVDEQGAIEQGRYWDVPPPREQEPEELSEQEACEDLRRVFDESVGLRMIADVPLGAFLSGGIDSSLVVASMARQSNQPVRTFSIGFDESDYNELPYASAVARQYGTEHHEMVVRPRAVELVEKLVQCFDEPFADSSAIPNYLVAEFAARHVKVVLSGDGGDELFGGYQSFFEVENMRRFDRLPAVMRRMAGKAAELLPYSAYGKNFLRTVSLPNGLERYFEHTSFSPYYLRREVLDPEWLLPTGAEFLRETFDGAILPDAAGDLSQAMHFEATAKLTGDILVKVDRTSMANSLEVRCPLLDHHLAQLASRIPNRWKTNQGRGKLILLKALGERLSPELVQRPKRGFSVPLREWFRGPLRGFLREHLISPRFASRGIASRPRMEQMLKEHESGRRDNAVFLWLLLVLELWFRDHERSMGRDRDRLAAPCPSL